MREKYLVEYSSKKGWAQKGVSGQLPLAKFIGSQEGPYIWWMASEGDANSDRTTPVVSPLPQMADGQLRDKLNWPFQ